jgi:hypothetical protein
MNGASAQAVRARSADYLFLSTASDARAIWVNPAGPVARPAASITAEFVLDRKETEDVRLAQWSAGFSSRGISFAYQRDRVPDQEASQAFRIGAALPFRRGAVGVAFTFYNTDETTRGVDLGLRYRPTPRIDLGAVLLNLGRPRVGSVAAFSPAAPKSPVTIGLGAGWSILPAILEIAGEAKVAERVGRSGYDVSYRLGTSLNANTRLPVGAFAAFDLESDFVVDRWALGISVGGPYRAILVSSGAGSASVNRVSLTGIALRELAQRRGGRR